ncbi:DEAD/DEAH box helicase family protein [Inhella proteolytica]|uniref:SWI2/SNF2 ATPase domain-containing protein n=1 Tax=Inhella proteolytica TaxID=2795029 RepID=A0A931NHD6_9BURK|nr:DEAD/DEAH box helicase family protein [Inhella proteolytica]MBH9578116.1 hypothetical protein [Inhella proteolytica]
MELLQHAEEHRLGKRDFDRRVALIGFDNAIESSVITFLSLHPDQRGGKTYAKAQVDLWLANFNSKVAFLKEFAALTKQAMPVDQAEFIYYHRLRNELYHNGNGFTPAEEHVFGARQAAVWTFSLLFESNAEELLVPGGTAESTAGEDAPLSPSTEFLQSFVEAKKVLDELLALLNKNANGQSGIDERLQLLQESLPVPAPLVQAAFKAERAKEAVVDGREGVADALALHALKDGLDSVAFYLQGRLREYQQQIVARAIEATVVAVRGDRRAGVVAQVAGTGLTMTLLAYIAQTRELPQLAHLPLVVLVDRIDLVHGLMMRIRDLPGRSISPVVPASGAELASSFDQLQPGQVLIATWQMLRSIQAAKAAETVEDACLLVGFNLYQVGAQDFDLRQLFPLGTFALFTSAPFRPNERRFEQFGELTASYEMATAVAEGHLLPVQHELRALETSASAADLAATIGATGGELTASQVHKISSDLFAELVGGSVPNPARGAVVVAKSREMVEAFANCLSGLPHGADTKGQKPRLRVVRNLGAQTDWMGLDGPEHAPMVFVSTPSALVGLDLGPSVVCYVTCKVARDLKTRLASVIARPRGDQSTPRIVDYAGNDWGDA